MNALETEKTVVKCAGRFIPLFIVNINFFNSLSSRPVW